MVKTRLDKLIGQRYPALSRSKIQELITEGAVTVNGTKITRSSFLIDDQAIVEIDSALLKYVSRAGFKLEHALRTFNIDVAGLTCLDAGLSTGGFTDCLLQHGARKVYGVDVGTAQVDQKIAQGPRVVIMENTDIRKVPPLADTIDLLTLDLSFISLTKIIEQAAPLLKPGGILITLIKPQFEVGFELANKFKGIITDPEVQKQSVDTAIQAITSAGFEFKKLTESPILGGSGNKEFLAYFVKKI